MSGTTATKHGRLGIGVAAGHSHISGAKAILRWLRIYLTWLAIVMIIFLEINAMVYFVFQSHTMPGTKLYGKSVSFASYAELEQSINQDLKTQTVPIAIQGVVKDFSYQDLGVTFSADKTFASTKMLAGFWNLPLIQLFTNGSISLLPAYNIDQQKMIQSIEDEIKSVDTPAQNAQLIFPGSFDEKIKIKKETYGSKLNPQIAANQISQSLNTGVDIIVEPQKIRPETTAAMLETTQKQASALIDSPIKITRDGKEITTIEPETIIRLLTTSGTAVTTDKNMLTQYIEQELSLYFYQAPVTKRINGGVVTAAGKAGSGLDEKSAFTTLSEQLVQKDTSAIELATKTIQAPEVVDGVYPKTEAGLNALIEDFDIAHYGKYNIVVQELRRGGMGASHGGVEQVIPASTYKAFIAYAALKSVERGEMTLDTMTPHGTLRDCIYEMIHVSTDHCAISIQDHMGWQKVDDLIRAAGFVNTRINNEGWGGEKYTTALDEYRLFRGYYDGTLLNKEHTAYMIDLFKNQMWRSGIPAGSAPAVVADKVGFYAGRENDVGIVYAPNGAYIIAAMSHGGSFGEISVLARQIYEFFGN